MKTIKNICHCLLMAVTCLFGGVLMTFVDFFLPACLFVETPTIENIHPYAIGWAVIANAILMFCFAWMTAEPKNPKLTKLETRS